MGDSGFIHLLPNEQNITKTIPKHTGKKLKFEHIKLREISIDSLNSIVANQPIEKAQIWSNDRFQMSTSAAPLETKNQSINYRNDLKLFELKPDSKVSANISIIKIYQSKLASL